MTICDQSFLDCPNLKEIIFPDDMILDMEYSQSAFIGLENTLASETIYKILNQFGKDVFGPDIIPIYNEYEKQEFFNVISKRKNSLRVKQTYNSKLIEAVNDTNVSLVGQLLEAGADPNGTLNEGTISPLGLACNKGNVEIVKLLLEFGADPNYIPNGQMSALNYAVMGAEKTEIIKYLIFTDVNINYSTSTTDPAIFWPVMLGHGNVTKLLIENGADITFRNKDGQTLLDIAKRIGWKNIVEILSGSANVTDMKKLVEISSDKLARNLIDIPNNTYQEPFWNNEIIVIPRGYLEIIDVERTMWGAIRYLVAINGTLSSLKPFYIETKRSLRTMYVQYKDLVFEDLKIRKTNYSNYFDGRIQKETYLFGLAEEI
jgi:ankyrin repeat protein